MEPGEKKWFAIFTTIIAVVAISIIIFLFSRAGFTRASSGELFECKTLKYSGEGAINLVFFSDSTKAKTYSDYLLASEPFNEYQDRFNVYYISEYLATCPPYKGVAVFCYDEKLLRAAASCPNDYIFVLKDAPSDLRSSAYYNVMSINLNHDHSVILHEFGHALANLAEEYTPARIPHGSQNCQEDCSEFNSLGADGCFLECSDGNHYRSIRAGVMRTLQVEDYGEFNRNLIRREIEKQSSISSPSITGNQISAPAECEKQQFNYAIYDQQTGEVVGVKRSVGCASTLRKDEIDLRYIYTEKPGIIPDSTGFAPIIGEVFVNRDVPVIVQSESVQQNEVVEIEIVSSSGETNQHEVDFSEAETAPAITKDSTVIVENQAEEFSPEETSLEKFSKTIKAVTFGESPQSIQPESALSDDILSDILAKDSLKSSTIPQKKITVILDQPFTVLEDF